MFAACSFLTNGLRLTFPLVSLEATGDVLWLRCPFFLGVTEYARRQHSRDLMIHRSQIAEVQRVGPLAGWGLDVELDNGAVFAIWGPRVVPALASNGMVGHDVRRVRWSRPTRSGSNIVDWRSTDRA